MPDAVSYLLCGTPRTGSTLLCGLLRSTGVAGRPESYFRRPDERSWAQRWRLPGGGDGTFGYGDYVRAAVAAGSTDNGVFGARVMWGSLEPLVTRLGVVHPGLAGADVELLTRAFGPLRFLHLQRGDTLAQAVSWVRAEQTGHWQHGDSVAPGHEPRFDAEQIRERIRVIDEHDAAWRQWLAAFDLEPFPVRYEDLAADPDGVTRGVLDFLGLPIPTPSAIAPRQHRQADEINHDWMIRYDAEASP